jgi:cell division protein FtsB
MFKIIKKNFFLSMATFLILYFFFNLLDGERGLLSYLKKKKSLINLQNKELLLSNKIQNLELKNSLLTDNLDLDFIEILIRQKFLFGKKEEKLYIIKKNDN